MLPRSPFKTEAQLAEEKERAELNARWNAPPPPRGKLIPSIPSKDARLMSPQELTAAWGNSRRVLAPCDAPSCIERGTRPGAQEGVPCPHGAGIPLPT